MRMDKYISREDIPEVLSHLYAVLCEVKKGTNHTHNTQLNTYHVIFSMGTIIMVDPDEDITPFEYTPEHMETWPVHRLESTIDVADVYKDLCSVYKEQTAGEYGNIMKLAFTKLFTAEDGVPILCSLGDVTMVQFVDYANIVECYEDNVSPLNTSQDSAGIVDCIDGVITMFEFDCMFPQIYALITPSLEILVYVPDGRL